MLATVRQSVIRQINAQKKFRKDDAGDEADEIDLGDFIAMIDITAPKLQQIADESGQSGLIQMGVHNNGDLVNQVNRYALDYAQNRSAEMVGMSYDDDGNLIPNPDAEWAITDSTRDGIQSVLEQLYAGEITHDEVPQAIKDAGIFDDARAEMIARTEISMANAHGSLNSYHSARKLGVKVMKAWEPDPEACPICEENGDAGAIDLDDTFPSGDDAPTAHPNCECVLVPVVDHGDDEDDDGEDS